MDRQQAVTILGRKTTIPGDGYTWEQINEAIDIAITALSPPNEPLTLDELREMDGEPVWIANPDALEYGRWGIVDGVYQAEDDQVLMLRGDYSCHYYGKTWLAYRRPPEGEEDT